MDVKKEVFDASTYFNNENIKKQEDVPKVTESLKTNLSVGDILIPPSTSPVIKTESPLANEVNKLTEVQEIEINKIPDDCISIGQKVNRYPISKFKGIKDFVRRIAVIDPTRIHGVRQHFEEGLGYYYCFEGTCCEVADLIVKYLIPVVVYETNSQGDIISAGFEIQYLAASEAQYDTLILMNKGYSLDLTDIYVSCADTMYQKLTFTSAGQATWKTNTKWQKLIITQYNALVGHVVRCNARRLGNTKDEAQKVYDQRKGHNPNQEQKVDNFDMNKFINK